MNVDKLVRAIWDAAEFTKERSDIKVEFADILKGDGWYVCETDQELRDVALAETDLVEPE